MNNKLIITTIKEHLMGFCFENDELFRILDMEKSSLVGNVYCGYVKDIVKNINAAFVEFDNDKKGFLSLKGIPYKVKSGDKILIQVVADKIKTKDYVLTWKINIKGKYCVLTVGNTQLSISKKITDTDNREKYKKLLKNHLTEEYGFIIRTNSKSATIYEISKDMEALAETYKLYSEKLLHLKAKSAIYTNELCLEECREFIKKYNGEVLTDNRNVFDNLKNNIPIIYNDNSKISLTNKYSLDKHLKRALSSHVWLKSGAYIIIEPTEAMTVIDVKTGKADLHTNRNKTFLKINTEAAKEIARQLQIRNISGTIIVDFINMQFTEDYDILRSEMIFFISNDYLQCNVLDFTKLGLLEITRKKGQKALKDIFTENI